MAWRGGTSNIGQRRALENLKSRIITHTNHKYYNMNVMESKWAEFRVFTTGYTQAFKFQSLPVAIQALCMRLLSCVDFIAIRCVDKTCRKLTQLPQSSPMHIDISRIFKPWCFDDEQRHFYNCRRLGAACPCHRYNAIKTTQALQVIFRTMRPQSISFGMYHQIDAGAINILCSITTLQAIMVDRWRDNCDSFFSVDFEALPQLSRLPYLSSLCIRCSNVDNDVVEGEHVAVMAALARFNAIKVVQMSPFAEERETKRLSSTITQLLRCSIYDDIMASLGHFHCLELLDLCIWGYVRIASWQAMAEHCAATLHTLMLRLMNNDAILDLSNNNNNGGGGVDGRLSLRLRPFPKIRRLKFRELAGVTMATIIQLCPNVVDVSIARFCPCVGENGCVLTALSECKSLARLILRDDSNCQNCIEGCDIDDNIPPIHSQFAILPPSLTTLALIHPNAVSSTLPYCTNLTNCSNLAIACNAHTYTNLNPASSTLLVDSNTAAHFKFPLIHTLRLVILPYTPNDLLALSKIMVHVTRLEIKSSNNDVLHQILSNPNLSLLRTLDIDTFEPTFDFLQFRTVRNIILRDLNIDINTNVSLIAFRLRGGTVQRT